MAVRISKQGRVHTTNGRFRPARITGSILGKLTPEDILETTWQLSIHNHNNSQSFLMLELFGGELLPIWSSLVRFRLAVIFSRISDNFFSLILMQNCLVVHPAEKYQKIFKVCVRLQLSPFDGCKRVNWLEMFS